MTNYVNVHFPIIGKSIKIESESKISDACAQIGHPLNLVCAGKGKCGKCTVDIKMEGKVSTVLACQTKVFDGLDILIAGDEIEAQILTASMLKDIHPNPSLSFIHVDKNQLITPMCENDYETLLGVLNLNLNAPSLDVLQKLSNNYHNPNGIKIIIYEKEIIDILPGESETVLYGLAFDIGSTSVVGYLYDLLSFKQLGISSRLNKQTSIGGDVISRIEYTMSHANGLKKLQDLVVETINDIIESICTDSNIDHNHIYQASFCGNSTMQHLFLGLNPTHLGLAPFTSTTHREILTQASKVGVNINTNGCINFLPLLGGFVGADTSAVLLSLQNDNKNRLVIDLGTNGEIAVGKNYSFKVASTACGPALEGAGLEYGMRGTKGAIERVDFTDKGVDYKVIGSCKPQGICGSAIVDIVSELLRCDIINKRGGFVDPLEVEQPELAKRMISTESGKAFVIAYGDETESGKPILMTQKDIRQVQLAKAAIFTGCNMLINECGLTGKDLDEILIAGAFGNYIDIPKAQYIGMIPYFENVPAYSIGNAAATGCQMFMLSKDEQVECTKLAENAEHIELASNPNFVNQYMMNTYLNKIAMNGEVQNNNDDDEDDDE